MNAAGKNGNRVYRKLALVSVIALAGLCIVVGLQLAMYGPGCADPISYLPTLADILNFKTPVSCLPIDSHKTLFQTTGESIFLAAIILTILVLKIRKYVKRKLTGLS